MTGHTFYASRGFLVLTLALAASTAACANVIVDGGGSSDGDGGSNSGIPGTSGSGTSTSPQAIAIPYKYLHGSASGTDDSGSTGASTTGSGAGDTDERLSLEVGSEARSCASPKSSFKCGNWSLSIFLQPALQHPGTFPIQYGDDNIGGTFSEDIVSDEVRDLCSGGGGPLTRGTLTIVEIDATHVVFSVQGIDRYGEYFDVGGPYNAPRCGP